MDDTTARGVLGVDVGARAQQDLQSLVVAQEAANVQRLGCGTHDSAHQGTLECLGQVAAGITLSDCQLLSDLIIA